MFARHLYYNGKGGFLHFLCIWLVDDLRNSRDSCGKSEQEETQCAW